MFQTKGVEKNQDTFCVQ